MSFLFKLILFVFAFLFIMPVITRKFANPYRLYLVFGKKGSGLGVGLVRRMMNIN